MKHFVIFDPSSTTNSLMEELSNLGHNVCAYSCRRDAWDKEIKAGIDETDGNKIPAGFCLSGSDRGISLSHRLNIERGFAVANKVPISSLYKKIDQQLILRTLFPDLALEVRPFDNASLLIEYLKTCDDNVFVRPNISNQSGSALFIKQKTELPSDLIESMFNNDDLISTHKEHDGTPYFINGVVLAERVVITDCWQCICLDHGPRRILTSVINLELDSPEMMVIIPSLQSVCEAFGITRGPVHFELVLGRTGAKIIKVVPRLAREPLPTLCSLLGKKGQFGLTKEAILHEFDRSDTAEFKGEGFVADYSFIVTRGGVLREICNWEEIVSLPSYAGNLIIPRIGSPLEETVCGSTYGATILLKNASKASLMADIHRCHELNQEGIFCMNDM